MTTRPGRKGSKISRTHFESAAKAHAEKRDATVCRYVGRGDDGNEEGAFLAFRNVGTVAYEQREEEEEEDDNEVDEGYFEEDVVFIVRHRKNGTSKASSRARVEVDVIYSPSYEVPVLCLRAFDLRSGSALSLDQTNRALVTKLHNRDNDNDDDIFAQLLAPWDRQQKLPKCSVGGGWVCVHPCETSKSLDMLNETSQTDEDVEFPFERWLRYAASRLKIELF